MRLDRLTRSQGVVRRRKSEEGGTDKGDDRFGVANRGGTEGRPV